MVSLPQLPKGSVFHTIAQYFLWISNHFLCEWLVRLLIDLPAQPLSYALPVFYPTSKSHFALRLLCIPCCVQGEHQPFSSTVMAARHGLAPASLGSYHPLCFSSVAVAGLIVSYTSPATVHIFSVSSVCHSPLLITHRLILKESLLVCWAGACVLV